MQMSDCTSKLPNRAKESEQQGEKHRQRGSHLCSFIDWVAVDATRNSGKSDFLAVKGVRKRQTVPTVPSPQLSLEHRRPPISLTDELTTASCQVTLM